MSGTITASSWASRWALLLPLCEHLIGVGLGTFAVAVMSPEVALVLGVWTAIAITYRQFTVRVEVRDRTVFVRNTFRNYAVPVASIERWGTASLMFGAPGTAAVSLHHRRGAGVRRIKLAATASVRGEERKRATRILHVRAGCPTKVGREFTESWTFAG